MIYVILALLAPFCFAIDNAEKFIELDKIDSLTISGGYYVSISEGKPGIRLAGDQDAIDGLNIETNSHGVTLSNGPKKESSSFFSWFNQKNYNSDHYTLSIQITLPRLDSIHLHGTASATLKDDLGIEKIELTGASKLDINYPISSRELDIELRGASFFSAKSIKTNQLMLQQSGSTRSVFSDLKIRGYAVCNISGSSATEAILINANQLKVEGSGSSFYNLNTVKGDELTIELYGVSSATIKSLKADTAHSFLHGSSSVKVKYAELKHHYEHNTGVAKIQYDELIEK